MNTIIYLHGFRSAPASSKARALHDFLAARGHADAFWAHALCKHAAKATGSPLVFERVGRQAPPGAQPDGCYGDDTPAGKWGSL